MAYEAKQPVYLPLDDFMQLEFYLMDARPGVKPDAFVAELVNRWLAVEKERQSLRERGYGIHGFQWKNVFLPDGTCMRTSYRGNFEFAKVVGDRIVADDGATLTPSQFANRLANGRNAWRFVWLRFPGNDYWIRACNCRTGAEELQSRQSKSKVEASSPV